MHTKSIEEGVTREKTGIPDSLGAAYNWTKLVNTISMEEGIIKEKICISGLL